jgi:hypothetical protein
VFDRPTDLARINDMACLECSLTGCCMGRANLMGTCQAAGFVAAGESVVRQKSEM